MKEYWKINNNEHYKEIIGLIRNTEQERYKRKIKENEEYWGEFKESSKEKHEFDKLTLESLMSLLHEHGFDDNFELEGYKDISIWDKIFTFS